MTTLTNLLKSGAQPLIVLAVLAAIGVLTVVGSAPVTSNQAYSVVMFITVATATAGGVILGGPTSNSNLAPHLLIILAILGLATALGVESVFTGGQISGIFAGLLGGGAIGVATNAVTTTTPPVGQLGAPPGWPGADPPA